MNIILPHNHFEAAHLAEVIEEMHKLGAPTIKAVRMEAYGAWVALEGAHRLRAAFELGLTPVIDEVEWSETVTTDEAAPGSYDDTWTIAEICDDVSRNKMITY
jgi:hypothetical protein